MMNGLKICCILVLLPSVLAAVYGITVVLRKYRGLYFSMGVLAVVCLMIGQLSYCITAFTGHTQNYGFHICTLGSIGCCLFFMMANIGPVNQLADNQSRKYWALASIGPMLATGLFLFCVCMMERRSCYLGIVTSLIMTLFIMMPLYFSTKMALIPDVEGGFLSCMRPYNIAVTVLGLLNTLECGLRNLWFGLTAIETVLRYALYGAIGLCTLIVMALLKRGAKQWMDM